MKCVRRGHKGIRSGQSCFSTIKYLVFFRNYKVGLHSRDTQTVLRDRNAIFKMCNCKIATVFVIDLINKHKYQYARICKEDFHLLHDKQTVVINSYAAAELKG